MTDDGYTDADVDVTTVNHAEIPSTTKLESEVCADTAGNGAHSRPTENTARSLFQIFVASLRLVTLHAAAASCRIPFLGAV